MTDQEIKNLKDFTRALIVEPYKNYWIRMFFNFAGFISASIVISSKPEEIVFQTKSEKELVEYLKTL